MTQMNKKQISALVNNMTESQAKEQLIDRMCDNLDLASTLASRQAIDVEGAVLSEGNNKVVAQEAVTKYVKTLLRVIVKTGEDITAIDIMETHDEFLKGLK